MRNRKIIYGGLGLATVVYLIFGWIVFSLQNNREMKVVFLNVGQGDAILLESGNNQVLIDGGRDGNLLLQRLGEFMPFWDRKIEAIVITHPDSDHFGGLIDVLKNYEVATIIKTETESRSQKWKKLQEVIADGKVRKLLVRKGLEIKFPNSAEIKTLFPFGPVAQYPRSTNETSVVMRLAYGKNSFLFTGDLPINKEEELLHSGIKLKSDVLKVGHHGSKFSTGDEFLEAVNPTDAVILVGKNKYGHPTEEVLNKLKRNLIRTWRTDKDGSIVYECKNANEKCEVFAQI